MIIESVEDNYIMMIESITDNHKELSTYSCGDCIVESQQVMENLSINACMILSNDLYPHLLYLDVYEMIHTLICYINACMILSNDSYPHFLKLLMTCN